MAGRNATAALVLELTGERATEREILAAGHIRKLAQERGGEWLEPRTSHASIAYNLRHEAVLNGVYHDDIAGLASGKVTDYICRAEALGGQP